MLVAVCIYSLAAGSAEKAAINLVDAFNYYGHQAYLVILNQAGAYQLDDKPHHLVINPKNACYFPCGAVNGWR